VHASPSAAAEASHSDAAEVVDRGVVLLTGEQGRHMLSAKRATLILPAERGLQAAFVACNIVRVLLC